MDTVLPTLKEPSGHPELWNLGVWTETAQLVLLRGIRSGACFQCQSSVVLNVDPDLVCQPERWIQQITQLAQPGSGSWGFGLPPAWCPEAILEFPYVPVERWRQVVSLNLMQAFMSAAQEPLELYWVAEAMAGPGSGLKSAYRVAYAAAPLMKLILAELRRLDVPVDWLGRLPQADNGKTLDGLGQGKSVQLGPNFLEAWPELKDSLSAPSQRRRKKLGRIVRRWAGMALGGIVFYGGYRFGVGGLPLTSAFRTEAQDTQGLTVGSEGFADLDPPLASPAPKPFPPEDPSAWVPKVLYALMELLPLNTIGYRLTPDLSTQAQLVYSLQATYLCPPREWALLQEDPAARTSFLESLRLRLSRVPGVAAVGPLQLNWELWKAGHNQIPFSLSIQLKEPLEAGWTARSASSHLSTPLFFDSLKPSVAETPAAAGAVNSFSAGLRTGATPERF